MPAFEYVALDPTGSEKKGVLEGDNPRQIRQQLRDQKLTPIDVVEGSSKTNRTKSTGTFRGGISNNDLALITRQVATLASSGTPIEEALGAVARQSEKQKIKIFPNPAKVEISFSNLPINCPIRKITIYDALVNKISEETFFQNQNNMNIGNLESGLYFLQFEFCDNSINLERLVIER